MNDMANREQLGTVASVATVAREESAPGEAGSLSDGVAYEEANPLVSLIKHGYAGNLRTDRATSKPMNARTVARIATVAVANPKMLETLVPGEDGGNLAYPFGPGQGSTSNLNPSSQSVAPIPELLVWVALGAQALYKDKKEVYSKKSLVYPVNSMEFQPEVSRPTGLTENSGYGEFATAIPAIFATVQKNRVQSIPNPLGSSLEHIDLSGTKSVQCNGAIQAYGAEDREFGVATRATVATVHPDTAEATRDAVASRDPSQGLPWRLREIATLVCHEVYQDDAAGIAAMLEDLTQVEPVLWGWLTTYFHGLYLRVQDDRRHPTLVTCQACAHAEFQAHAAIALCGAGVHSGLATAGFWATDRHVCERFSPQPKRAETRPTQVDDQTKVVADF